MVGNGMAGLACLDAILQRDPSWNVTVFGDEPQLGYNRILLSTLLAGECGGDDTITHDAGWYASRLITLRGGVRVVSLNRERRCVRDDTGLETPFDGLVLATGSEATGPPIAGWQRAGVRVPQARRHQRDPGRAARARAAG
jgi:NAD(P)H-nitrite reductase large subunit